MRTNAYSGWQGVSNCRSFEIEMLLEREKENEEEERRKFLETCDVKEEDNKP